MKKLRSILLVFTLLLIQFSFVNNVSAANITIDGKFNDWNGISKTSITSNFYSKVAFVQSGNKLYMYAEENGTNSWEKYFSNTQPTLILQNHSEIHLVITEQSSSGDNSDLVVRNQNGYSIISGSSGKRVKKGTYVYELVIPVDEWGDIDSVRINTDYSSTQTIKVQNENATTTQPTTKQPTTKPGPQPPTTKQPTTKQSTTKQPTTAHIITTKGQSGAIVIDGHYDDWADYPHVLLTNWNMPENQRTKDNCRQVSLIVDDDNIYFHVRMIEGWPDPFNGNEFELTVGDHTLTIELRAQDGSSFPKYNMQPGIYQLQVWYKNRVPGHEDDAPVEGAACTLTVVANSPDEVEVLIPKEDFHLIFGMDVSDIREVTLTNPNLFDHGVSSSATPTYPWVGVAICIMSVVIALAVIGLIKRKKLGKN